jgi:protein SCO1/2
VAERVRQPVALALGLIAASAVVFSFTEAQSSAHYVRSEHDFAIPSVSLEDQNGAAVSLPSLVGDNKFVLLDFFYTRCKTVCPIVTSAFANFQYRLKPDTNRVRLVSITIDPEHDSAGALALFKKRYRAQSGWTFLTGKEDKVQRAMKTFSSYTKNKLGFYPLAFLYLPQKRQWIQFEGYIPVDDLITEYLKVDDREQRRIAGNAHS